MVTYKQDTILKETAHAEDCSRKDLYISKPVFSVSTGKLSQSSSSYKERLNKKTSKHGSYIYVNNKNKDFSRTYQGKLCYFQGQYKEQKTKKKSVTLILAHCTMKPLFFKSQEMNVQKHEA